jgi:biotin synthase
MNMKLNAAGAIRKLIDILESKHDLDRDSLAELLVHDDPLPIYNAADRVRKKYVGNQVHLRGLIEFSSYCCNTCHYCGLRSSNKRLKRFRMMPDEIIKCARHAVSRGLKTIVLQSGEDRAYSLDVLCKIVYEIKKMNVAVTLSLGELSRDAYANLKKSGADRYLLRIETSNEQLYEKLHPGMSYRNRVRCLYDLKELDYETGTGCLVGLPGQTAEMLAEDLLFFKKLDAGMIGIGPFIPCAGTPLEGKKEGSVDMVLKMMALTRLLMPDINIPATTALSVKDSDGYQKGLNCGANVIMPNMGLKEYMKLYSIYPGKGEKIASYDNHLDIVKNLILKSGRSVGNSCGSRQPSGF